MNRVLPCQLAPKPNSVREHDYSISLIKIEIPTKKENPETIFSPQAKITESSETEDYEITELFIEPVATNVVKVLDTTFCTNILLHEFCQSEVELQITPIGDARLEEEFCSVSYLLESCKICLKDLSDVEGKISFFDEFGHISNEINEISIALEEMNVEVTNDDILPKQMCPECYNTFVQITTFKQICKRSNIALYNIRDHISRQPSNVKDDGNLEALCCAPQEIFEIKEVIEASHCIKSEVSHSHQTNEMDEKGTDPTDTNHFLEELKSFICTRCGQNFNSYRQLCDHNEHNFCGNRECRVCKEKFSTLEDLDQHIEKSHKTFPCSMCTNSFNSLMNLKRHERRHETLICDFCTQFCYSKKSMRKHLLSHIIGLYPCPFCEQRFASRKSVGTHKRKVHPNEKYKCPHCPKEFKIKDTYRVHIMKHNPDKRHKCTYCTSQFVHRHHLENHIRTHTKENPFLCNFCGKAFRGEVSLRDHLSTHDPKAYPRRNRVLQKKTYSIQSTQQCDLCSYTSIHGNLKKHMSNVHGHGRELREFKTFAYSCHVCDKAFRLSTSLENHLRIHNEVRDFHCTQCKASFRKAHYLRIHIDGVHLNKRPNKCDQCDAAYLISNDLKRHKMQKHSNDRPYQCHYCRKAFAVAQSLKLHIKRLHTSKKNYDLLSD